MNITGFRKDIKNQFDNALKGEDILIERGGMEYQLVVKGPAGVQLAPSAPFKAETPISRGNNGMCKVHGLPLDSRGRCLQKGCKYS